VGGREGEHFASVDAGLRGYKARHNLAVLCQEQGRYPEAEAHWRAALADRPDYVPAWVGLADVLLAQRRRPEAEAIVARLRAAAPTRPDGDLLHARILLARQDFGGARAGLEALIAAQPRALPPRVLLSHVLLQAGADVGAAERALRDVLALAPDHAEARQNLAVLLRRRGRPPEPAPGPVVTVDGHRLALHPPAVDRWVSAPLAAGQPYEPFQLRLALSLVGPGDRVLDVGANVGVYTLPLAPRVGPAGRVYAVEPDPGNFALLRGNVARNGYENVVLLDRAAAARTGPARLYRSADNQGDHRLSPAAEPRPSVAVAAVRLDDVLADAAPVALVKLDVQGAEGLALAGMRDLLGRSPGARLLLEFWPWGLARAGTPADAVLADLTALGFTFGYIDEARGRVTPVTADGLLRDLPLAEDAFVNLLCARDTPAADLPSESAAGAKRN
jgi:FkbM family methyltransferase